MSVKLKELQEKRNRALGEARRINEVAARQRRSLDYLETLQINRAFADSVQLRNQIDAEIRAGRIANDERVRGTDYTNAVRALLLGDRRGSLSATEQRALSAGNDAQGGFLTLPEEWAGMLNAGVTDLVFIRDRARVYTLTKSGTLSASTIEANPDDPEWTTELGKLKIDTGLRAGLRQLHPHLLTKGIILDDKVIRGSAGLAEMAVIDRLKYKVGIAEEKGFLVGDGNQKPLGVFTPHEQGIPVTRDVTGTVTYDTLLEAKFGMKSQYWRSMEWVTHRDVLKAFAMLKDGNGQYVYRTAEDPSLPDVLLGRPVNLSEYAPNTLTSGSYVAVLGDFSHYTIADCEQQEIKILSELYALDGAVGIIIKRETDGAPTLAEAFARVKVA